MTDKPTRPLTPTAEELRLQTEQDRLARAEAQAAKQLRALQCELDEVTTRLNAMIARRIEAIGDAGYDDALTDQQREQTAKAIIDAGRKRRNEPTSDSIVPFDPFKRK